MLWTMPRIVVDVFTPNDSVAACLQLRNLPVGTSYWDAYAPSIWGSNWKNSDGFYYYEEEVTGNGTYEFTVDSDADTGWYTSIEFYNNRPNLLSLYSYNSRDLIGSYDVYVFSDHSAYLYVQGTYDAVEHATPTAQKNFNS